MFENLLATNEKITWCPGCGNFAIWGALKEAITQAGLPKEDVVLVYGIGCHGKMVDYLNINGFEGLHGRALPLAAGIKMGNDKLKVIAVCGDGDCYGEGLAHFLHSCRLNYDLTLLVHNNGIYGLTTGQASPTSPQGLKTKTTPEGNLEATFNPVSVAISAGASFVARGFAGDLPGLKEIITQAVNHHGFSFVDILQPCVTFNKINTYDWYRKRIYNLDKNYPRKDKNEALIKSEEWEEKLPLGIIFQNERQTINEYYPKIDPFKEPKVTEDFQELLSEFSI